MLPAEAPSASLRKVQISFAKCLIQVRQQPKHRSHIDFKVAERKNFQSEDIQVHKELILISEQKTQIPKHKSNFTETKKELQRFLKDFKPSFLGY